MNRESLRSEIASVGNGDATNQGTVKGTSWSGVTIDWDDGDSTSVSHNDMAQVDRVAAN